MSTCYLCKQEIGQVESCLQEFNGQIPFGGERWDEAYIRCPKCGVERGKFHHPSCEWEECPECYEKLVSCTHEWDFRKMPPYEWMIRLCAECGRDTQFIRDDQGNFICDKCKTKL